MAGMFINGVWSMGFDMDPTPAQVFTITAAGSMQSAPVPFGTGFSYNTGNGNNPGVNLGANLTQLIHGIRFFWPALPVTNIIVFTWYDLTAGAAQVTLRVNAAGNFQFYLGSGTGTPIGPASTFSATVNTWTYLECQVIISATVGQVQCWANGTNIITTTATQNTKSTANAWVSAFFLPSPNGGGNYDDWYMLDGTAAAPLNAPLGNVQVKGDKSNANSAVGGRNAYTPTNPQNDNHLNVGNIPVNTAQYNADSTPGDYDMFRFPAISAVTVFFINEWVQVELDAAGARTVALNGYSASGAPTDSLGTAFTPPAGSLALVNNTYIVDPSGGAALTPTTAGNMELGVKTIT